MKESATFTVLIDEYGSDNLKKLKEICDKVGVKVELEESQELSEKAFMSLGLLYFSWDNDDLEKKLTRKAGRKSKFRKMEYKPEEIRMKIKEQGADATARELGISRQYMYKRLKEAEQEKRYYF